jgi:hypothetical protein
MNFICHGSVSSLLTSVYRVYSANTDNILMWICVVYYEYIKEMITIECECYSWEKTKNVGLDASFDNMQDWKGVEGKAEKFILRMIT